MPLVIAASGGGNVPDIQLQARYPERFEAVKKEYGEKLYAIDKEILEVKGG